MINADAAYQRGLTGAGIRLAVLDSGTWLEHPELAGKGHAALLLQERLEDGSLCPEDAPFSGPGACVRRSGGDPALEAVIIDDDVPEEIRQRIEQEYGEAGSHPDPHGTLVAGVIAGNRDGQGMHGVAFNANLSVAADDYSRATRFFMEDGVLRKMEVSSPEVPADMVASLYSRLAAQGVRVLNNSWGDGIPESLEALQNLLADESRQETFDAIGAGSSRDGLLQVWAAGNGQGSAPEEGFGADVLASLPYARPELESLWLSVVNVDASQQLAATSMKCGVTANWCLAAPGEDILSSAVIGSGAVALRSEGANTWLSLPKDGLQPTYLTASGTSFSAPYVTGALGLLMERFPYLDNAQVRDVLLTTASDLGAPGVDDVYGWGLVNLEKAIEGYGQLRVDTHVVMNQRAGGRKVWQGGAWDDWSNDIGGPGRLTKSGIGWLRLSGDNHFNGALVREGILELNGRNALASAVVVEGGELRLNGSLSGTDLQVRSGNGVISSSGILDGTALRVDGGSVTFDGMQRGAGTYVGAAGRLGGSGMLGPTRVDGLLAPGDRQGNGTLRINGDYDQGPAGTLHAPLANAGPGLLAVSGRAMLGGTLAPAPVAGQFYLGEQFNLLNADGGIQGRFATVDTSAFSPFLQLNLLADANALRIDVQRGAALRTGASTPNQHAVADTVDALPVRQGLPQPLAQLFPQQLGSALDALSGELHAAAPLALAQSSRHLREAALSRDAAMRPATGVDASPTIAWVQAIGGAGSVGGSRGRATTHTTNGLIGGAEYMLGDGQIGAALGTGRTDVRQGLGRQARLRSDDRHLALYGNHHRGALNLGAGLAYSSHRISSNRQVQFAGFSDALSARQRGSTRQAFAEGSYRFGTALGGLQPYLQVARIRVDVDDVHERGGAAALRGRVGPFESTVAATGVRFDWGLKAPWQEQAWLRLNGGFGYQRGRGDREGAALLGFDIGEGFGVASAAVARGAWRGELGVDAWVAPRQQLRFGYSGTFASDSRDHNLNASWSVAF